MNCNNCKKRPWHIIGYVVIFNRLGGILTVALLWSLIVHELIKSEITMHTAKKKVQIVL